MIDGRLNQANGRLRSAKTGVAIEQINNRLYLVATPPPKPRSLKANSHQQRIALGIYANIAGVQQAEKEACKLGVLLSSQEFSWNNYLRSKPGKIGEWIERAKQEYLHTGEKKEDTWEGEYWKILKRLPFDEPLTEGALKTLLLSTEANTRIRRRAALACAYLADCAGIEHDLRRLTGNHIKSV